MSSTDFVHAAERPGPPSTHMARIAPYLRLASVFRDRIAKGEWVAGSQLPTLPELCTRYGVARNTVRQALQLLTDEGLVTSTRGKGTFVNTGVRSRQNAAAGIDGNSAAGTVVESQTVDLLLRQIGVPLPPELASAPAEDGRRSIAYVRILRMHRLAGKSFNLSDVYVANHVHAVFPVGADEVEKISDLTQTYAKAKIVRYRQQITLARADAEVAAMFGCPIGDVLVRIRRWRMDSAGELIFAAVNLYAGDLFVLNRVDEDSEDLSSRPGFIPDESGIRGA